MGVKFDWDEPDEPTTEPTTGPAARRRAWRQHLRRWGRRLALVLALLALVAGAVTVVRRLARPSPAELRRAVDLVHSTEGRAITLGDHALFLSLQDDDPAWRAAQYHLQQAHPPETVTIAAPTQHGDMVRAWQRWDEDGVPLQRMAFYRWDEQRLRHVASDPAFWGDVQSTAADWGTLRFHAADQEQAATIAAYIGRRVDELCRRGCITARRPLTVTLAADHRLVAADGGVSVPSPHLLGMTADGAPGDPFWRELDRRLVDVLLPATVHFAVPDALVAQTAAVAARFSRAQPDIAVEIVPFSTLPATPAARLAHVDAALMPPTLAAITGGHVLDLTDLAAADPAFTLDDLYPVARDGAVWQERLWLAPQFAEYRLIYTDRASFSIGVLSADQYLARIWQPPRAERNAPARRPRPDAGWGYLDVSPDSLFAYAFDHRCAQAELQPCRDPLTADDLAATLAWYAHQVAGGIMPDASTMRDDERQFVLLNSLGYPRQTPMWAGLPGQYEHNVQLGPADVTAFAGSDGRGITPFTVHGSVISAHTPRPRATWAWISYLSTAGPLGSARALPVFAAGAEARGYWANMPAPLRPAVETAFGRGRAVRIAEADYFAWPDVAAVVDGTRTPADAADAMAQIAWFGRE